MTAQEQIAVELWYAKSMRDSVKPKPKLTGRRSMRSKSEILTEQKKRRKKILAALDVEPLTRSQLIEAVGAPITTIAGDIGKMRDAGLIHATGNSRSALWHIGPKEVWS